MELLHKLAVTTLEFSRFNMPVKSQSNKLKVAHFIILNSHITNSIIKILAQLNFKIESLIMYKIKCHIF